MEREDEEESLRDALLERAQKAVDAAAETVAESEVIAHISAELRDAGLTSRCAWCGRFRVGDRWVTASASPLIGLSRSTHTICEDCVVSLRDAGLSA